MVDEARSEPTAGRLHPVNWVGLAAGAAMLIVPFLGAWWRAEVASGVLKVAFSPFHYRLVFVGQALTSTLVDYLILAAKLVVLIGGVLMITGSLAPSRWWGRKLVRWGAMKVLWMLVGLVILVVIGAFFMNRFLPSMLTGMMGADLSMRFELPYLIGAGQASIRARDAIELTAPMTAELTRSFWLAVATAVLGVGARVYHGRFLKGNKRSEE